MTITKHAALLLMTLVGLTGLLNAQAPTRIKTQVPFDFVVNGKTMPAGECTIAVDVNGRTVLSISSGEQHVFAVAIADVSANARKKDGACVSPIWRPFLPDQYQAPRGNWLPVAHRQRRT